MNKKRTNWGEIRKEVTYAGQHVAIVSVVPLSTFTDEQAAV